MGRCAQSVGQEVAGDGDHDDASAGRDVEPVGDPQAADAEEGPEKHRQQHAVLQLFRKQGGHGSRGRQQCQHQNDAGHADQHDHGHRHQNQQQVFQKDRFDADDGGELLIEEVGFPGVEERDHDRQHKCGHNQHQYQVRLGHRQDVAEKIGIQIGRVARHQRDEDDAESHAQGPKETDQDVRLHAALPFDGADPERCRDRKKEGADNGLEPEEIAEPDATVSRVGNPAAHHHQLLLHDDDADDAADDARQQACGECIL